MQSEGPGLALLPARQLLALIDPPAAIDALRTAYRALDSDRAEAGKSIGFRLDGGSLHVKAALLPGSHEAFAAKVNVNLPGNPAACGLPTIQGVVMLVDTRTGRPLALLDSASLTAIRTAATAALAATWGARSTPRIAAIIGCGAQARQVLAAFRAVFPGLTIRLHDQDSARAVALARSGGAGCTPAADLASALAQTDIVVTCTTAKAPVLTSDHALEGCFIAALGADNPAKQEVDPLLMGRARVIVDDLDACATGGDLSHAIAAGTMTRERVVSDLAALAAGRAVARRSDDDLVIYDSTGSGVQDVAIAWLAYRLARNDASIARIDLAAS